MKDVFFIYFPQLKKNPEKCARWVKSCGRPTTGPAKFTVDSVTKDTYICSKHFVGEGGPTSLHPDPVPALASEVEKELFLRNKKRKSPTKRRSSPSRPTGGSRRKNAKLGKLDLQTSAAVPRLTGEDLGILYMCFIINYQHGKRML